MKEAHRRFKNGPVAGLSIHMTKYEYPRSVGASFRDGKSLQLDYVPTWRMCFAFLRSATSQRVSATDFFVGGEELVSIERPFRHHVTIPWPDMTYKDWINLCLAYRTEME
jgi:hypothetical protein